MTYQKLIVPIDHGNRNLKTENHVFTSGIIESDCRPVLGEYMYYNGRYYALSDQRIPYMRDKSNDERFFILTLFGIAKEAEKQLLNQKEISLQVGLPVGLPPKHYGALHKNFRNISWDGECRNLLTMAERMRWRLKMLLYFRRIMRLP